jgi:hypothetical protein
MEDFTERRSLPRKTESRGWKDSFRNFLEVFPLTETVPALSTSTFNPDTNVQYQFPTYQKLDDFRNGGRGGTVPPLCSTTLNSTVSEFVKILSS